jgi:type II secretory pathway component PulC
MRSRAIYTTLVFALIFFLSGPPLASAGASGETVEKVLRPESANVSSPPPATSAAQETSALRDAMPPKRLPLAPRSLGLRLVGTVVAEDQEMSLAIIEHEGAGKQRIYYEGARADKVLIKSILRNEVIIDAGRGDQRLIMLHGQAPGSERAPQQATRGQFVPQQQAPSSTRLSARYQNVRLARDEVAAALSDLNEVMKEVRFSTTGPPGSGSRTWRPGASSRR